MTFLPSEQAQAAALEYFWPDEALMRQAQLALRDAVATELALGRLVDPRATGTGPWSLRCLGPDDGPLDSAWAVVHEDGRAINWLEIHEAIGIAAVLNVLWTRGPQ